MIAIFIKINYPKKKSGIKKHKLLSIFITKGKYLLLSDCNVNYRHANIL